MKIRALRDEDFVQYKVPSMFIGMAYCDWKCCHDAGIDETVCQNHELATAPIHDVSNADLIRRYLNNDITHAIVFGGLEPMLQYHEIAAFISELRQSGCYDTVVIYTGYTEPEIAGLLPALRDLGNIVVKFGRYMPHQRPHLDDVLGVKLASDNQYAMAL